MSQAVNVDIPMNCSSGAETWYKSFINGSAAAKPRLIYQKGIIGSECEEMWYEERSLKGLCKNELPFVFFFFEKIISVFILLKKSQWFWLFITLHFFHTVTDSYCIIHYEISCK